jgi:hypothetical protein
MQDEVGAFGGEAAGDGRADAARGTRDHYHFASEIRLHG